MRHKDDDADLIDSFEVSRITGLPWAAIKGKLIAQTFPMPVKCSRRCVRWWRSEVEPFRRR